MRILVAEDDPVSVRVLDATLGKWGHEVTIARNGVEALRALESEDAPQLAILDWMMPEMDGVEVCRRIRASHAAGPAYIILLTAKSRKEDAIAGLEAGADDYLTKPFDRNELRARLQVGMRIIELQSSLSERIEELEAAIVERQRAEDALRNMTLTDDLTGLYNRRGFFTLTEQSLKLARRMNRPALLIYADMDGLKEINDTHGHNEGSLAIQRMADVLRQTFRESDVIARLGGDEFTIFAIDTQLEQADALTSRLAQQLQRFNTSGEHHHQLSLSFGIVAVDSNSSASIKELIATADKAMYEQKRKRRKARLAGADLQTTSR